MPLVYVLNINGSPLMPTHRFGKVRHLLRSGKAKIVKREPFTIQLTYECGNHIQSITLGIDAGSKHIGLSASTEKEELYCSDVETRNDIVELLSTRRQNRRTRRNRLRYRKPRFDNRVHSKNKGWLAPSVEHKINTHIKVVNDVIKLLPITQIIVEVASFDIQKIKTPNIEGKEYQQGEQLDFWNTREYVLFRDNHTCQCCKGKSKDERLNVHHIESRKTGGNAPNNLITLCETCHNGYHQGKIKLPDSIKREKTFKDAAFMGIMRWTFYNRLKELYPKRVLMTFGYITKNTRIENGLAKEHYNDAYCIAQNLKAKPLDNVIYQKKVRCHNRQIHKVNFLKGGKKKLNQAPHVVKGFRLFDKVKYQNQECFIFGRRSTGYFDIRLLDGTKIHAGISYKKLKLLKAKTNYLQEERSRQFLSHLFKRDGVSLPVIR